MKKFFALFFCCILLFSVPSFAEEQFNDTTPEVKEFIQETNDQVDYYVETKQLEEKKVFTSLKEIYDQFIRDTTNMSYSEYVEIINQSKQMEKEIFKKGEIDSQFRAVNGSNVYTGDIILTNAGKIGGWVGHAGFAIDTNKIISAGPNVGVYIDTYQGWINECKNSSGNRWIMILRPKNAAWDTHRHNALKYVKNHYMNDGKANRDIKYGFDTSLKSTNPTYCSKIPFQAYKFGAKVGRNLPEDGVYIPPKDLPVLFNDGPKSLFEHSVKLYHK